MRIAGAILFALIALLMLWLAFGLLTAPDRTLTEIGHSPAQMAPVLAGRYVMAAILALMIARSRDPFLFIGGLAAFSIGGFWDHVVYARAGGPPLSMTPHLRAGLVCAGLALVFWFWRRLVR